MADDPSDDLPSVIGTRLRAARATRGLSLASLAAEAGIGKGSLSEIENAARNPNLATLYALARALGVPLSWLLAERAGAEVASPGITARLLETVVDDRATLEVFLLDLGADSPHRSQPHGPGVVERLMVVDGRARVGRVGAEVDLGPGESASWVSDVDHGYLALDGPARAVLAITWPGAPTAPPT